MPAPEAAEPARTEHRLSELEVRFERMTGTLNLIEREQVNMRSSFDSWHKALDKGQDLILAKMDKAVADLTGKIDKISSLRDQMTGAWYLFAFLATVGAVAGVFGFIHAFFTK